MKRISRQPERFGVLNLFAALAPAHNLSLADGASYERFLSLIKQSIETISKNPIILHGVRIQAMFAFVAASLGRVILLKEEDAGEIYTAHTNIRPPDFRLHLEDGQSFLVEVKNQHDLRKPLRLSTVYLDSLRHYAELLRLPLRIAVYWSKANIWTLVSEEHLPQRNSHVILPFELAAKINEMADLGDMRVATTSPLSFRFVSDPTKPRAVDTRGEASFTIGAVEFYCAGRRINRHDEQNLAFYLMLFGNWAESEPRVYVEENQLVHIEHTFTPREPVPDQEFQFVGPVSSIASRHFSTITAPDGQIKSMLAPQDPESLGVLIPQDYKGVDLPLWRFVQEPNYT